LATPRDPNDQIFEPGFASVEKFDVVLVRTSLMDKEDHCLGTPGDGRRTQRQPKRHCKE
jgi:hypothetical protein